MYFELELSDWISGTKILDLLEIHGDSIGDQRLFYSPRNRWLLLDVHVVNNSPNSEVIGRCYRYEIVLEINVSSVGHALRGLQKKHWSPIQSPQNNNQLDLPNISYLWLSLILLCIHFDGINVLLGQTALPLYTLWKSSTSTIKRPTKTWSVPQSRTHSDRNSLLVGRKYTKPFGNYSQISTWSCGQSDWRSYSNGSSFSISVT
jgi:hypothetical protein